MASPAPLTIGRLAREAGVKSDTIRYYERRGLLPRASRRASGYREYDGDDLARLRFIREAQTLGFTLEEIGDLLRLKVDPRTTCTDVRKRAEVRLAGIEEKIASLQRFQSALRKLVNSCQGTGPTADCLILAALDEPAQPVKKLRGKPDANH